MGPGTLNISGPEGANGTIGIDQHGIVYTEGGFASPFINIGPATDGLDPGAIGGWLIGPTGTYGTADYDLIVTQKQPGAAVPAGLTGPHYSLTKGLLGPTGITGPAGIAGPTGPAGSSGLSLAAGNSPYETSIGLITTLVGTTQTRIYQVGPVTATAMTKFLIMVNVSMIEASYATQLTVGRSSTSGASAANSTNIVSGTSPVTLPVTTPSYALAAGPHTNGANGDVVNLNGFAIDIPGAGTFYYTVWMSSTTSHNYSEMAVALSVLQVQ